MKSSNAGTALALLGAVTSVAGQYAELTLFGDDALCETPESAFVFNGMQSWVFPLGDGVVDFSTCVSVDDPDIEPATTVYVKYECINNVVSMTEYSEAACTNEVATTTPYSNCTYSQLLTCVATEEELDGTPEEEWVSVTTFYEDSQCTTATGTAVNQTVAEIIEWDSGGNETCAMTNGVYATIGCVDGFISYMWYGGDNGGCTGEWTGIYKPQSNCWDLEAEDAGYASVSCSAVVDDDEADGDGSDDMVSGSSLQAVLLPAWQLFITAMTVATMATLASAALFG